MDDWCERSKSSLRGDVDEEEEEESCHFMFYVLYFLNKKKTPTLKMDVCRWRRKVSKKKKSRNKKIDAL